MNIRRLQDKRLVQRVDNELVVYDEERHKAYHLNETAAIVWEQCDDAASVDDLVQVLAARSALPADEAVAQLAIQELRDAQLIEGSLGAGYDETISRRELAARMAGLAVALPAVVALLAPTPAMAESNPEPE